MSGLIYFSSRSGNTRRFVQALGIAAERIPIADEIPMPAPRAPFILITPTYADGQGHGAVAKPVIRFLNDPENRRYLRGVIASGNRNFGALFALAGEVISHKCKVPVLHRFELAGTPTDIALVTEQWNRFSKTWSLTAI